MHLAAAIIGLTITVESGGALLSSADADGLPAPSNRAIQNLYANNKIKHKHMMNTRNPNASVPRRPEAVLGDTSLIRLPSEHAAADMHTQL